MPYSNREQRRAVTRRNRRVRLAKGLCEKCPMVSRPGKTTCATCGRADSARKVAWLRRNGTAPRYDDRRGYGDRQAEHAPRVPGCPRACPRCAGFVVDVKSHYRCVNCGWAGWPETEMAHDRSHN